MKKQNKIFQFHSQGAFTLLEVMVSMLLFLSVSSVMAHSFIADLKRNTMAENRTGAIEAATRRMDELRYQDPTSMPTSGTVGPVSYTVGRDAYDVYTTYCPVTTYCVNSTTRHIRVNVKLKGKDQYTLETVYAQLR